MAEIGLTPQSVAPPTTPPVAPPQTGSNNRTETRPSNPTVDQLEISPEAEQRLTEVGATDREGVTSTRISEESEVVEVPDFARQRAVSNLERGIGLFEPPPELFDERV